MITIRKSIFLVTNEDFNRHAKRQKKIMTLQEFNQCVDQFSDGVYRFILKNLKDEEKATSSGRQIS